MERDAFIVLLKHKKTNSY